MSTTYFCEKCNYSATKKYNWELHLASAKHNKLPISTYDCNICNNSYDELITFYSHCGNCIETMKQKHQMEIVELNKNENILKEEITAINNEFTRLREEYKTHYDFKQVDTISKSNKVFILESQIEICKETSEFYKKQVDELKTRIISLEEQNKKLTDANIELVTKINQNQYLCNFENAFKSNSFNLQFYLENSCKNAPSIEQFVTDMSFSDSELYTVCAEKQIGLRLIIQKRLGGINQELMPFQCCDKKRKKLMVKTNGQWINNEEVSGNNNPLFRFYALIYIKFFNVISQLKESDKNRIDTTCSIGTSIQSFMPNFILSAMETTDDYRKCSKDFLRKLNDEISELCIIKKNC